MTDSWRPVPGPWQGSPEQPTVAHRTPGPPPQPWGSPPPGGVPAVGGPPAYGRPPQAGPPQFGPPVPGPPPGAAPPGPPFGQPPGMPPYGPPPRRRSTALIVGVICAIITVVCVTATLLVAFWPDDEPTGETLRLAENVTITVDVPSGWKTVRSDSSEYPDRYLLVPRAEQRSYTKIDSDSADLTDDGVTIEPISVVEFFALECSDIKSSELKNTEDVGAWTVSTESTSRTSVSAERTLAFRRLDDGICFVAHGLSAAQQKSQLSDKPNSFVQRITKGGIVSDVRQRQ